MTVSQFSREYGVPQSVVYNATFRISYEDRRMYDGNYPHDVIMKATIEEIESRNSFHQSKLDKNNGYLMKLTGKR